MALREEKPAKTNDILLPWRAIFVAMARLLPPTHMPMAGHTPGPHKKECVRTAVLYTSTDYMFSVRPPQQNAN